MLIKPLSLNNFKPLSIFIKFGRLKSGLIVHLIVYSKTCEKQPLKIDKTKILMTNCCLMKVNSIAECYEHSAILLTCIKR